MDQKKLQKGKDQSDTVTDAEYMSSIALLSEEDRRTHLNEERNRFHTLRAKFDMNDPTHDITALAANGFYYDPRTSTVRCAFCDAMNNHEGGGPCSIITNEPTENIPFYEPGDFDFDGPQSRRRLQAKNLDAVSVSSERFVEETDPTGVTNKKKLIVTREKISKLVVSQAYYKTYMSRKEREDSFKDETAKEAFEGNEKLIDLLIDAGFFYKGPGDKVICFFCDGSLEQWVAGDIPWKEHCSFYYRCPFLRQCKGMDYIREVLGGMKPYDRDQNEQLIYTHGNFKLVN